jgi:trk system potassium uptake protein TrkH
MPAPLERLKSAWGPPIVHRTEVDLRLVPLAFFALIVIGTALLWLPWTHRPGQSIGPLDAFFLATSATCVTGLSTVNVADTFNFFGQGVLLFLIQAGGLGIFTASISLVLLSGQKLSLADEHTIRATLGRLQKVRPLDVFIYGCIFVFLIELAGAVALFYRISDALPEQPLGRTAWESVFHSISAFCNAGISIYPDGLARWRHHADILGIINLLVISGGIGLMALINLRFYYFWRRDPRRRGQLTLQTKLSLTTTAILLGLGTLMVLLFEQGYTLIDTGGWETLSWAFFHSTMTRTAGFNIVDMDSMNPPTLLCTLGLMFIGGAPGSMAGGIKTITFAVLVLTAWSALRRRENIQIFGKRISPQLAGVAVMLALLAIAVLMLGVGLLMITERGAPSAQTPQHWLGLVFEAVSAFGTVGLSTGVTPLLTSLGKVIIILLMFIGRVAPLMLSIYLARPTRPWHLRVPSEDVGLG